MKDKEISALQKKIDNTKSEGSELEKKYKALKLENNELSLKLKLLDNLEEKDKLEKDPLEFYDIIIYINSMQDIKREGWKIKMNENGRKLSEDKSQNKRLIIGVLGNRNKGKSFILQALSGEKMQTGTTINTIGLSIQKINMFY